ncbi:hypothetical protein B0I35DRAFT_424937 [Stachybotrys elegans]|uniref:NodB homology domain-containing protein n=1 Tax=Stachybotrys elegans TaxID=80388 RepID=A0A8K0SWN7_9HYPO|nr:hypothetical protein B0I35DRAFT_424937 [Stachybotrys elegans]
MIRDGHQVASHTWSHQRLTTLSRSKFFNQMHFLETALADLLGYFPTYMRPPYSASNATTDAWLGELGYHITYFNLDTEGYLHDSSQLIQQSKDIWDVNVEGRNPQNTMYLHIEHDPVYQSVYNLTGHMLESLVRNNFRAVTVGECLGDPQQNWYRSVSAQPPTSSSTTTSRSTSTSRTSTSTSTRPATSSTSTSTRPATSSTTARSTSSTTARTTTSSASNPFPTSTDGRCGPRFGNATCISEPGATCCSQYGWCGSTVDHCVGGCQPLYGTCGQSR